MATDSERLEAFIAAAKARGVSDEFAVALLRQNGWSERRIYQAFSTYYERVLGTPLPSRGGRVEYAGEAFLYLLAFTLAGFLGDGALVALRRTDRPEFPHRAITRSTATSARPSRWNLRR